MYKTKIKARVIGQNVTVNKSSEMTISYKNNPNVKLSELPQMTTSIDTAEYLRSIWSDKMGFQEEFYAMFLNRANRVLGWALIGAGGVAGVIADPKVIFAHAILAGASSVILAHNHPSGNLKPSHADMELTKKYKSGGKVLDLEVLDHIIMSPEESHFSFLDEGLMY